MPKTDVQFIERRAIADELERLRVLLHFSHIWHTDVGTEAILTWSHAFSECALMWLGVLHFPRPCIHPSFSSSRVNAEPCPEDWVNK